MNEINFATLYVNRIENWRELADLLNTENTQVAYTIYLQIAATDEHHFSSQLRQAAIHTKDLFDRFLALDASQKRQILEILRS
jgi:ADP-heptose:LPS heptosyltransferase